MFKNILLAIDLSHPDAQRRACAAAAAMARQNEAELHVATVVPDFGMSIVGSYFPEGFEDKALAKARHDLEAFTAREIGPDLVIGHVVGHGSIYREIIRIADETGCDLIVLGAHRPELRDYLLGQNVDRVVRHAKQSVIVIRDQR